MTQPAPPAPPGLSSPPSPVELPAVPPRLPAPPPTAAVPPPGDEVRDDLRTRLRVLAPLLIAVLVFSFFHGMNAAVRPEPSRLGLVLQLVLLALMMACAGPLYAGPGLSLHGLRVLELLLFGLAATYLAWLHGAGLLEAWTLRTQLPAQHEPALLRLALGAITARWLLLIVAYGAVIPNTPRRCALVLAPLVLMPLIITASAGLADRAFGAASRPAVLQMAVALLAGGGAALFACGRLSPQPPPVAEAGLIGNYRLGRPLHSGLMGEVYLAEHVLLRRRCALKLIGPGLARDPAACRRFEREARALAALRHPNAVAVHDSGRTDDGTPYYVMEYLSGVSLADLVAGSGPLPPGRAVYLLLQLCDALAAAHGLGILHLDIKPGNVFVGAEAGAGDVVKLFDFGLAREVGPDGLGLRSSADESAGSPQYMAPEQAAGPAPLDARTDLYGVGGVAYFLLTGRPPFDCDTPLQLVLAHAWDPVTPPSRLRPEVPADLEEVVLRCLAKTPGQRFADAAGLARALRQCACAADWDAGRAARQYAAPSPPTDAVAQGHDGLEGLHRRVAVVDLLGLRQLGVGHQARVVLQRVVALGSEGPALGQPLPRPDLVGVLGQALGQLHDLRRQRNGAGVDGTGNVVHGVIRVIETIFRRGRAARGETKGSAVLLTAPPGRGRPS